MEVDLDKAELLNTLLDELDLRAQQQQVGDRDDDYWVCRRQHARHPFRAPCVVRFFQPGGSTIMELAGRTRNLSRNGLGLLVKRVFRTGEPMELEVHVPGKSTMFMAGLVAFCRYAGRAYHEIGLGLKGAGSSPIFSSDPLRAISLLGWLREAQMPDLRR